MVDFEKFELRDFLSGRARPETGVKVLMSEKIAFEIAALNRKIEGLQDSSQSRERVSAEKELETKLKERDDQLFTVRLRGVSRRRREDIQSQALHAHPMRIDLYGRDAPEAQVARQRLLEELIFAEHMTKIVDPGGRVQELDDDNRRDVARAFLDEAPDNAIARVDVAIGKLRAESEMESALVDVDF